MSTIQEMIYVPPTYDAKVTRETLGGEELVIVTFTGPNGAWKSQLKLSTQMARRVTSLLLKELR
jgi:hypothetical protein